jgi:hypothetical protein
MPTISRSLDHPFRYDQFRKQKPIFHRAGPARPWSEFINALVPDRACGPTQSRGPAPLKSLLAGMTQAPSLYWYPGSGKDLSPLAFDVPGNPTGQRLLRLTDPQPPENPTVLFMNDYRSDLRTFPTDGLVWTGYDDDNTKDLKTRTWGRSGHRMWDRYDTHIVLLGPHEFYNYTYGPEGEWSIPISLGRAIVTNNHPGARKRPHFGDEYLLIFSCVESHRLFQEVILKFGLHIRALALIRQGGFSGQLHYDQYTDIPAWVMTNADQLGGQPEFIIADSQGQNQEGSKPLCSALSDYEYVGGPVNWGWAPCRAYAKPGTPYRRQDKTYVNGQVQN